MNRRLYVGNLNFEVTEDEVKELFGQYGEVQEVKLVTDRYTGRPRGFAFVKMGTPEAATEARDALNGQNFRDRKLAIDWARTEQRDGPRPEGAFRGAERGNERGNDRGERGGERRERSERAPFRR